MEDIGLDYSIYLHEMYISCCLKRASHVARDVHLIQSEMHISCIFIVNLPDDGKGRYRRKGTTSKNLCNLIVTESLSVLQRSAIST